MAEPAVVFWTIVHSSSLAVFSLRFREQDGLGRLAKKISATLRARPQNKPPIPFYRISTNHVVKARFSAAVTMHKVLIPVLKWNIPFKGRMMMRTNHHDRIVSRAREHGSFPRVFLGAFCHVFEDLVGGGWEQGHGLRGGRGDKLENDPLAQHPERSARKRVPLLREAEAGIVKGSAERGLQWGSVKHGVRGGVSSRAGAYIKLKIIKK